MNNHMFAGSGSVARLRAHQTNAPDKKNRVRLSAAAALATTILTPMAHAQTPQAPATPPQGAPSWVTEVVVTGVRQAYTAPATESATRTDTPLIDVPQSVQVITGSLIKEQDRRTLGDALVNVSGVTPTLAEEFLFTSPIIRGFPAEIYLDGLPLYGATQAANDPTSLVGVERIDVLKGPNATLYAGGVGTPLGGLINIESVRPTDRFGGFVALRGGSFNTVDPYGDINLPLAPGVAARVTGEYQSNGSWIDKLQQVRWSLQPSISFQLDPKTDLWLQAKIDHRSQLEYSGLPAPQALAGEIDRNAFPGAPDGQPRTTIDNEAVTAELRHNFSDDVRLTISGRYYRSKSDENGSFVYPNFVGPDPATPTTYPIFTIDLVNPTRELTADANMSAKINALGGQHELLAGFDYDHTNFVSRLGFTGVPVGNLNLANPDYNLAYGPTLPTTFASQTDSYDTLAGYAQDQATYGRLHLTGSLRFTQLKFHELEEATDQTFQRVSPRIGATFEVLPGVALYAAYATAFRGPFGVISATPPKPETSENIEAGMKLALTRFGLSGTVAVFDQTRHNVATPDPNDVHYSIQTGAQEAKGVEADLVWEPIPAFSLLANYAHTDARVTEDDTIPVGDRLTRVPQNSGRIAARYRVLTGVAKGLSFGAGVTAFDSRPLTLPNTVSAPGYAVVDAQAAYEVGRYTIELSVVNLNGSNAFDPYEYLGYPLVIPTQPRSAYITLKARF